MATLLVLNGHNQGEWYSIGTDRPLVVGRDDTLLAEIIDPRISHRHLEVSFDPHANGFRAMDLQSRNGTKVDGHRCRPWRPLNEGSEIRIGHTLMLFTKADFETYEEGEAYARRAAKERAELIARIEDEESYGKRSSRSGKRSARESETAGFSLFGLFKKRG